jgi:hypothetical protein
MMRPDLHLTLADGTEIGYAEVGDPGGAPVSTCMAARAVGWK